MRPGAPYLAAMARRWMKAGIAVAVAGGALALVGPRLLDTVYYRGPVSDHFDGERFFNPGRQRAAGGFSPAKMWRIWTGDRAAWPAAVPLRQTKPPARVHGSAMRVTWIGHATVLVQTQGLNILTDPVWSERASPVGFAGPKRVRAPGVAFADLPRIDLVLVSHNHYDHLDLATLDRLWRRDRPRIVVPLGNDTLLARRGIAAAALDWGGRLAIRPDVAVIAERVHHWSSRRGADRNRALWSGFTVALPGGNLFFAGDTGAGDLAAPGGGWPAAAARRGPVRLALLPIGAYHPRETFGDAHIDPDQAVAAFRTLGAAQALGIHWGTFQLTGEAIDAPPRELGRARAAAGLAPDRFRTTEAGEGWDVPALR